MEKKSALRLTESAVMLAFAVVLSMVKLVDLPYGGSVTAFSMLPPLLIAYRYGTRWGLFTALAYSLLQLLMGLKNLNYATSAMAVVAILVLDYVAAFLALGLGGVFRRAGRPQAVALTAGTLLACALRYLCHVISGCTVWAGLSIPDTQALLYSLAYNATYMLPETLITVLGALYLSRVLDFGSETITRTAPPRRRADLAVLLSGLGKAALCGALVWDVAHIAPRLQDAESGNFDITGIAQVNAVALSLITAAGVLLFALLLWLAARVPADHPLCLKPLFRALPLIGVAAAAVFVGVFVCRLIVSGDGTTTQWTQAVVLILCWVAAAVPVAVRTRKKTRT